MAARLFGVEVDEQAAHKGGHGQVQSELVVPGTRGTSTADGTRERYRNGMLRLDYLVCRVVSCRVVSYRIVYQGVHPRRRPLLQKWVGLEEDEQAWYGMGKRKKKQKVQMGLGSGTMTRGGSGRWMDGWMQRDGSGWARREPAFAVGQVRRGTCYEGEVGRRRGWLMVDLMDDRR